MVLVWDNFINEAFTIMAYFMLTFGIFTIIFMMVKMLRKFF